MKIGLICKYPPIVGGVSSKAFWLSRALAEQGHEIHIITNAYEVESTYKEILTYKDIDLHLKCPNLHIHATPPNDLPAYIPRGNPFEVKLANLAIEAIQKHQLEILDCWYFVPNGVAGYIVHTITGIPWIIRHAGSDLGRILPHHLFKSVLRNILLKANRVVTYKSSEELLLSLGLSPSNIWFNHRIAVDTRYFKPDSHVVAPGLPQDKPVILTIGKIGNTKGTFDLLKSFRPLRDEAYLAYITGGPNIRRLQKEIKLLNLEKVVTILPPIPPWRVPDYFCSSRCVVHVERNFPIIRHRPILPREVLACGKCLVLSEEMYNKYDFLKAGKNVLVVNPHNHKQFTEVLKQTISNSSFVEQIGMEALATSCKIEDFSGYVNHNVELYTTLINKIE